MTALDLIILGVVIYAMTIFISVRTHIEAFNTGAGFSAIVFGLSLVAMFYLVDLFTMHVLPFLMPMTEAMGIMKDLHLNHRWWVSLIAVGSIAIGLACASRAVFELIEKLKSEVTERENAEHEMRQSAERYHELFDDSPAAIWEEDWSPIKQMLDDLARGGVKDWRGYFNSHRDQLRMAYDLAKITEISRATVDIYRAASKEELVRWSTSLHVIDEELDAFLEIVLSFLAGQMAVEIESKDSTMGESDIMLQRRVVIPPKYCDDWSRVIYAIEDITGRKIAEEALRESEANLANAQRIAGLGNFDWNMETDELRWSDEVYRLFGFDPQAYQPSNDVFVASIHPDDRDHVRCSVDEAVREGKPHKFEYRIVRPNGEVRHLRDQAEFILGEHGKPAHMSGTTLDITDLKEAEEALRKSDAHLTAILENAPVEIYLKDAEGRYVLINRQYERLWSVKNENVRGKLPGQIHEQEDFAAACRAHDLAVLQAADVIEQDEDVLMEDGLHTLHMIKFPIRDAAGKVSGLGAIATDVTESKRLEQVKNELISSVSHELRTPMASVLGALGLVQGGAAGRLPEKAQSMIDITYRNCNRLVRLLNDVLDIEKMGSGNSNFEMSRLELAPLARDAIETIAAFSAEYDVEVRLVEDSDFVEVLGDGDRLIQVLTNLLSNAIKFSPKGGVVEVRISRSDDAVRVSVKDCGPGIPEDFHDQVFNRFAQADRTDSRCGGGTGLGLSICKMITDQHDGSIGFDTEIGAGTTFYFDLTDCADGESSTESAGIASRLYRERPKRQGGQL